MKFGGTSVADAERIAAAAEIVRGRLSRRPIVVVSALAGVTDLLVRAVTAAREGQREALDPILADLTRRHRWAIAGSVEDPGRRHALSLEIDTLFEDLRQLLRSVRVLGEGTPKAEDALLAFGEILSASLVTSAFAARGVPARLVDAREVMITDGRHGAAEPDLEAIVPRAREKLAALAEAGAVPVVGGFFGAAPDGRTTTLGRGGSDTTAAVLGAALDAEEIEIWTDVDGVMTADPRRVEDARPCASVSFAEAAELAYYGAKVLHPASIAPAVKRKIPVRVLNALRPEAPGTVIALAPASGAPPLASVASRAGVSSWRVSSPTMRIDPGFLPRVLAAVDDERLAPDLVVSSEVAVTLVLPRTAEPSGLSERLARFATVERRDARGIVCVVGSGLAQEGSVRGRVLEAIGAHDPELLALGGSATSVAALIPEARLDACVRDLHRRFFTDARS
ncbi:MAG TPA: aspartate kinase [Candidatus Polarisedimenticolaceae bacterium]|nr:aspartate kinase [Candidatus Polarisedimenticolaceae bacterium]